ncbi:MAG: ATP synthase subunit I [Pseudomonadota bacterium]
MSSDPVTLLLAALAGVMLGLVFFVGLWWTVQRGLSTRHPALLFLASLVLRMTVAIGGFWWVAGGQWDRLLACLVGFLLVRLVMTRWSRMRHGADEVGNPAEERHAP